MNTPPTQAAASPQLTAAPGRRPKRLACEHDLAPRNPDYSTQPSPEEAHADQRWFRMADPDQLFQHVNGVATIDKRRKAPAVSLLVSARDMRRQDEVACQ